MGIVMTGGGLQGVLLTTLEATLLGEYLIGGFNPLCWFLFVIYDRQHCATLLLVGFFRQC